VGPRAVLDALSKRKIPSPHKESNPYHPIVQPVASRYTEWGISALGYTIWDGKRSEDILDNIKDKPVTGYIQNYKKKCKEHMKKNEYKKNLKINFTLSLKKRNINRTSSDEMGGGGGGMGRIWNRNEPPDLILDRRKKKKKTFVNGGC
jgi:hypothetical protein